MKYLKNYRLLVMKCLVAFMSTFIVLSAYAEGTQKIIINEFLALNSKGLKDADGDNSDWIELYNPGTEAVNMEGWTLTDNAEKLDKWVFPAVTIGAGEYLVLFASDKNRRDPGKQLHTNFKLSGGGEYLGLLEPGKVVSYEYTPYFPAQQTDVSYGYYMGQHTTFNTPTPGSANTLVGQVLAPVFSIGRGFYEDAFSVTLSIVDPDTKIYYTTDGNIPDVSSTLYTGPVNITTTTPLSAIGFKNGISSQVVTNTYFFIKDIVNQPNDPAGYPDRWGHLNYGVGNYAAGERTPADYAMDPNVCNDPAYKDLIKDAFLAIPTISVVTNSGYIFSHSTDPNTGGIYIYTGDSGNPKESGGNKLGDGWERPASIEFYEPGTGKQFQINCGLRLHGGNSRKPYNTSKHSFRAHFKKQYGAGNLNYDLFEDETASDKFGHLIFRAGYNFSWLKNSDNERAKAQYIYDSFAKKTQLGMGHHATHDRFAHFFINGLYWGLYDISERVRNKFTAEYMGGDEDDYDVVDDEGLVEGQLTAYNQMLSLAKAGKYNELISGNLLNAENFVDYMLLNFYIGNNDWGKNNWYAARNRVNPGKGFQFFSWDAENSLNDININRITTFEGPLREMLFGSSNGSGVSGGLCSNKEFKLLLADRIQKHFFANGVLTKDETTELYKKLAAEIDLPVILESARWGDFRKNTLPHNDTRILYTRNDHWLPVKEDLLANYFPKRTEIVFNQLKNLGLYSSIDAPVFSSGGGSITDPVDLSITATSGSIYFTTDGTDPRDAGTDGISEKSYAYDKPLHVVGRGTIKARAKNGSTWSALSEVTFKGGSKETFVDNYTGISYSESNPIMVWIENDILYYTLPTDGNVVVEVFTADGKSVRNTGNTFTASGTCQIDLAGLSKGIYIFRLKCNENTVSKKIIK